MPATSVTVYAYPECQGIWMQLDSASQLQVRSLGSILWDARDTDVGETVAQQLLYELESRGVFVFEVDKWRFVLPEMLFFVQSINIVDSLALSSQSADEVRHELLELLRTEVDEPFGSFRRQRQLVSFVIAQLVNEAERLDVVDFLISEKTANNHFWSLFDPLCDAFAVLDLEVEETAVMLEKLANRVRGDMAGGKLFPAVGHLGRYRPDFASRLVDQLASGGKKAIGYIPTILTGIARSSPNHRDETIMRCDTWLASDREDLCQAAIYCSQNLILGGELDPDWLVDRYDTLLAKPEGVRCALAAVITIIGANFEERSDECLSMLQELKQRGPQDQVAHSIASTLPNSEVRVDFRLSCLSLLTDVPTGNKGTIRQIGSVLYPITLSQPGAVWPYLEGWVLEHEREEPIAAHNMFLSTIQSAYQHNPDEGRRVLTRWFASPDLRLVEEARIILRELKVYGFDPGMINSMPSTMIEYVTEKLLVGSFPAIQWMSLFSSIVKSTSKIEELTDYFSRAIGYLTWNYPCSAAEFLDEAIDEEDTSRRSVLLRKARQELEDYRAERRGVLVPELLPSRRRALKYLEFERKKMRSVQEAVFDDDRFPLQKLVSRVVIGRGERTFHMNILHPDPAQRRTFTEPRGFGEFSQSIELPRGETIDPEGEIWNRFQRLSYTLDESQGTNE